jgi:quercetin dioxygenase-like cupin family protein
MKEPTVIRLADTDVVPFGPDAHYQLILGDDEGTTPIRTGIQTSQPGYVAPLHSHPYLEVLHVLEGVGEAWIEGGEDRPVRLERGDTIALQPDVPHSFRVVGDQPLRTFGIHVSPRRIVHYADGGASDARGYRVWSA